MQFQGLRELVALPSVALLSVAPPSVAPLSEVLPSVALLVLVDPPISGPSIGAVDGPTGPGLGQAGIPNVSNMLSGFGALSKVGGLGGNILGSSLGAGMSARGIGGFSPY